jgi:antibiotic biosynthesis monooxygenase (ABM) superfamily enzyme
MSRKAHKENALKDDQQFGFTKRWFNAKTQRKRPAKFAQVLLRDLCISLCVLGENQQFGFTKRWFNAKTQRKRPAKFAQVLL